MKLKFSGKLILDSVEMINGIKVIRFASFLKEDYIERLVKISIKNNCAVTVYFSSNSFGTATWMKGRGFVESHRWEVEEDLGEISYLAKHYPALLENGMVSEEYALDKIAADVLMNMIDPVPTSDLYKILKSPEDEITLNWDEIINRNKKLSSDFIDDLISKYESEKKNHVVSKNETDRPIYQKQKQKQRDSKKEIFITETGSYIKSAFSYIITKYNKFKVILINHKARYSDNNRMSGISKTGEDDDIQSYIERAKKLSKKIKRFK